MKHLGGSKDLLFVYVISASVFHRLTPHYITLADLQRASHVRLRQAATHHASGVNVVVA